MRPGRLDRILYVSPPDLESRRAIFRVNFAKMAVHEDVNVDELAIMVRSSSLRYVVHWSDDEMSRLKVVPVRRSSPSVRMLL